MSFQKLKNLKIWGGIETFYQYTCRQSRNKAGLFFVRFKGNSILTKNAETRILLQNSILFLTKLIFPVFLSKFVELKLVFVWLEAISNQSFG